MKRFLQTFSEMEYFQFIYRGWGLDEHLEITKIFYYAKSVQTQIRPVPDQTSTKVKNNIPMQNHSASIFVEFGNAQITNNI